jgi:transglutaminase-like putative cysteine protease
MTGALIRSRALGRVPERLKVDPFRVGALLGAIGLVAVIVTVLVELVTVTGDPRRVLFLAAVALLVATPFARYVRPRIAFGVGVAALVVGLSFYLLAADIGFQPRGILADWFRFLTGMSVLEVRETTTWALGVTPAPVFLTWYFALRYRYTAAALVGSATVGFFVLTGDAGSTLTLLGVASVAAVLGFGDLEQGEGTVRTTEYLVLLVAVMLVTPLFISVVPSSAVQGESGAGAGTGTEASSGLDGSSEPTMSGAVVETGDELDVIGSITLSTDVQFTVQADRGQYWRTGSYDRYTGDGWIDVDGTSGEDEFRPAEGPNRRIDQTVRIERRATTMPAAWRPFAIESGTIERSNITAGATIRPNRPLAEGETYTVSSAVPDSSPDELRAAGTDYPANIEQTYTQLPSDVPDRVRTGTDELVADAETPYGTAVTIERYLRSNKEYSLSVDEPEGDIADSFLFEMDAGYCTYFATTMVTMLRSQGIPARVAVGYSTGQQVAEDKWVVRGTNAHAWVEVYFPERGWKTFDPTPQDGLRQRQISELENARQLPQEINDPEGISFDTRDSWTVPAEGVRSGSNGTATQAVTREYDDANGSGQIETDTFTETDPGEERTTDDGDGPPVSLPSPDRIAVLGLIVLGLAVVGRRSAALRRTVERLRVRYRSPTGPAGDVERSFDRLLYLLERRHRPRKRGETIREYLAAIEPDSRVRRVATIREQAQYRGTVSESMAEEAFRLVDELADDT